MIIKTAEITQQECQNMINLPGCVERLLVEKGFEKSGGILLPRLKGKISTWRNMVTGSFHYTQEISD